MLQDDYIKQCFINASKKKKNRNDVREVLENLDEHTELLKKMLTEELFIPDYHKPSIINESSSKKTRRILQEIGITGAMFDELKEIIEEMRKGVPLGYFTSQWFGNFYLKALDHYIKEELHAEHYMRYMDDMVILGKSKKKLHKIHAAIETYLNDNLDLEIKGDWQVFRFEYPVFDKGGNPVLDKDGKQVTKGRMLDFMGFQFHHDRTTIRKSNIEAARRKANHISKQDKISWYNASVMLSYMGLFKHTDTYNYYIDYIKPKINVKKLKRIVSKHSRKENEHDRLEKGDRNTAGQAGGGRQDIVAVNGLPA